MELLGPATIRERAARLGVSPTKKLGQNFLHDGGTVRKIVRESGVQPGEVVVEVGPGLGSLTLGLLEVGAAVCAVEIDPVLAEALPHTVAEQMEDAPLIVTRQDALTVASWAEIGGEWPPPDRLIANLPYNVAVPILLRFLALFPSLKSALVMVQSEVADRLVAGPGSRTYGIPSVKVAWYGSARRASAIGRKVFWPEPNVDSALVDIRLGDLPGDEEMRESVFRIVDQAFSSRRKMIRGALKPLFGEQTSAILDVAGVEGSLRGEDLGLSEYLAIALAQAQLNGSADE